mmetsp:Transcript_18230/g.58249  ORF Transcript_18230/g.58249 Transcript_18230/m.58249 type:complete len:221 (+) Transcript_18230:1268-1930(+)
MQQHGATRQPHAPHTPCERPPRRASVPPAVRASHAPAARGEWEGVCCARASAEGRAAARASCVWRGVRPQVGSCSSRSGWSVDGLHPIRPVLLQYMSLAFNLAADLGEYCAHEPGSGNHHHGGGNHSGGSAHDGSSAHGGHAGHGHVGAASGSGDAGASSRSSGIGTVAQRVIGQALGRARRMRHKQAAPAEAPSGEPRELRSLIAPSGQAQVLVRRETG